MTDRNPARRMRARGGHTLIELMIALVIGVSLLMSASAVAISTMRSMRGAELREGVARQARYVGMSLERDLAFTGVELESTAIHGSLSVRGDTLVILHVPVRGTPARPYSIHMASGDAISAGSGSCGSDCVRFTRPTGEEVELEEGSLAVLATYTQRRLVVVDQIQQETGRATVNFANVGRSEILHHAANFSDNYLMNAAGTAIQEVNVFAWWRDEDNRLLRAERVDLDGDPVGEVVATGVTDMQVSLIFTDGTEADEADATDPAQAFDRIAGVRVQITMETRNPPPGEEDNVSRVFEWRFTPRNLIYERNRAY